jgi:hypothetical protein
MTTPSQRVEFRTSLVSRVGLLQSPSEFERLFDFSHRPSLQRLMAWAVICAISRGGSVRLDPVGRCDLRRRDLAAHAVDSCDCTRRVCADPHEWLLWGTRNPPVMCPSVFARRTGTSPCGGPLWNHAAGPSGFERQAIPPRGFSLYQGGWAGDMVSSGAVAWCASMRRTRANGAGELVRMRTASATVFSPSQILAGV